MQAAQQQAGITPSPRGRSKRRALRRRLAAAVLGLASAAAFGPPARAADPAQVGQWDAPMGFGAAAVHMALMHTGNVLIWRLGEEARVWNPATGEMVSAPFLGPNNNIECAGQVALADGRVLTVSGQHIKTTTTFDPLTLTWTRLPDLNYVRWYPSVTMLPDGRALAANGEDKSDLVNTTIEVYDPTTNTWKVLPPSANRLQTLYAANFLLPSGKIFEATANAATGLLDLTTNSWTSGPASGWSAQPYSDSAAMYAPGKIIRTGGVLVDSATNGATSRTAIVDMTTISPAWQETSPMAIRRKNLNLVLLADGEVMAVGGSMQSESPSSAALPGEIWNPATKQWTTVAAMTHPRMYHSTAVLLPDGRVLSAGGAYQTVGLDVAQSAQVYSPPYLFKGPRPSIDAAPGNVGYGSAFTISTADAASISSVAVIRPGAMTHGYDMDQRYVPLDIQGRAAASLTVSAPANANWAPPGWYMLVLKNSNGVPSVAKWVQVSTKPTSVLEPGPAAGVAPRPAPSAAPPGIAPGAATVTAAAGASPSQAGSPATSSSTVSITMARRIRLRDVRRRGLAMNVHIPASMASRSRVVRIRVLRLQGSRRRVVTTGFRSVRSDSFRITMRSPALRHALRPGRYQVEVAAGASRSSLQAPRRQAFTIVR